ncbi:MAG: outer membrane protein transport protein, partial [Pseudomonadota bacterium]
QAGANTLLSGQNLGTSGTGNISSVAVTPASYLALNLGMFGLDDRISIGLSNTTPFGSTTENDYDSAARFHGRTSEVRVINSSPTIGFRVNEAFSVAAGLQVSFADVRLTQAAAVPSPVPGLGLEVDTDVEGFDRALGWTVGATFSPTERTEIGIGFRSAVFHELDGTFQVSGPSPQVQRDLGGITAELNLPELLSIGLRHQATQSLTLLAGFEWQNWSRFKELRIDFDTPGAPDAVTLQNYEDGYYFSLGAEYAVNEDLTVRGGLGYEISPVQDEFRSVRQPDSDRIWASLGASYEFNDRFALNVSYSHIFADDAPINLALADNPSRGTLRGEGNTSIDIVGISLRSKFGHSAPTEEVRDVFYKP